MTNNDNVVKIGKETTAGNSEAGQSKNTRKTGHRLNRGNSSGTGRAQGSRKIHRSVRMAS